MKYVEMNQKMTCRLCNEEIDGAVYDHRCKEVSPAEQFQRQCKVALEMSGEFYSMRLQAENNQMRKVLKEILEISEQRGLFGSASRLAKIHELSEQGLSPAHG